MAEITTNSDIKELPLPAEGGGDSAHACGAYKGLKIRISPKGKRTFYLYYKMGGKSYKYKIGLFGDIGLPEANRVTKKLKADIALGNNPQLEKRLKRAAEKDEKNRSITLRKFLDDEYFAYVDQHHKSAYRTKRIIEHNFKDAMNLSLLNIDVKYIEDWRNKRLDKGLAPSTLNRAVTCIKAVLNTAVRWKFIDSNPMDGTTRLKIDKKGVVRFLSKDEETMLLKALDEYQGVDYIKTFVILLLNTGARPNEAKQLKWSDIDLKRGMITLRASYTKTGQTRHIPINDKLSAELERWHKTSEDGYLFKGTKGHIVSVQKPWNAVIKLAKVENFRLYDLRHTFASKLMMNGADIYTVGELLGHTDTKTTQIYAHLSSDHLRSAVDLL